MTPGYISYTDLPVGEVGGGGGSGGGSRLKKQSCWNTSYKADSRILHPLLSYLTEVIYSSDM